MNEFVNTMKKAIKQGISNVHTAMPGTVLSYSGGIATVQPSLPFNAPDGRSVAMPPIVGVPVVMPTCSGGTIGVSLPIQPGDGVLLVFSERSLDDWSKGGESADPRRHDLTDAIAIPGCYSGGVPANSSSDLTLFAGSTKMTVTSGKISIAGGDLEVDGVSFKTHVHGGVTPGGGNTAAPVGG